MTNKTKIFLIDDHPAILESLIQLIGQHPLFEVVGSARQADGVADQIAILKVDMLITNIVMPGMDGLELTGLLRKRFPELKIVLLSAMTSTSVIRQALRLDANGYISKAVGAENLFEALARVIRGETTVLVQNDPIPLEWLSEAPKLSKRQTEILCLLCDGRSMKDVATLLSISIHTVQIHLQKIKALLQVNTLPELTAYTIKNDLCK